MSIKALKLAEKSALHQREVLKGLQALALSFDRSEELITDLKTEMEAVNAKHQNRSSTREDIAYLEDLLRCAKKKLVWEKQMEKLRTRTPEVLKEVGSVINDPVHPPTDEMRSNVLACLQSVQAAMERLDRAKS